MLASQVLVEKSKLLEVFTARDRWCSDWTASSREPSQRQSKQEGRKSKQSIFVTLGPPACQSFSTRSHLAVFFAPPYFPPGAQEMTCQGSAALLGIDAGATPALTDKC